MKKQNMEVNDRIVRFYQYLEDRLEFENENNILKENKLIKEKAILEGEKKQPIISSI
jgi:hypothetical protein